MTNSSLQRFDHDGIELIINTRGVNRVNGGILGENQ
jgi:hypothetical protein